MTDLPYDIIRYIMNILERKSDILNFLSTKKYYLEFPYQIGTDYYDEISKIEHYRNYYPYNFNIKEIIDPYKFALLSKIEMNYTQFKKIEGVHKFKHIVITKGGKFKKITINNNHIIEKLELNKMKSKPIEINCDKISWLKLVDCDNSKIKIIDKNNNLKNLDVNCRAETLEIDEICNPNLVITSTSLQSIKLLSKGVIEYTNYSLGKLKYAHGEFFDLQFIFDRLFDNIKFGKEVIHRCILDEDDICILKELTDYFDFKGYNLQIITQLSEIHIIEKKMKICERKLYSIDLDIDPTEWVHLVNCRINKMNVLINSSELILESCDIDTFEFYCKYEKSIPKIKIKNCKINYMKNIYFEGSIRSSKIEIHNSTINEINYNDDSSLILVNSKINRVLKYNNDINERIYTLYGNISDCYYFKSKKISYLNIHYLKLLKLQNEKEVYIYGHPEYIYIYKQNSYGVYLYENDSFTEIENSNLYEHIPNKSYIYEVYKKNNLY